VPLVGNIYRSAAVANAVDSAQGALVFVMFLNHKIGLLHGVSGLRQGDVVDVVLLSITAEGKYRLGLAPPAGGAAPAPKRAKIRPDGPTKRYNGLGVRTWEDVADQVAAGGWTLVAANSNAHWRRATQPPPSRAGDQPLIQHLYLARSPSDSFHGPQKAATTMRRLDRARDAWLDDGGAGESSTPFVGDRGIV
jgi:hypothetical protein